MRGLVGPYGGELVDLVLTDDELAGARDEAEHAPKLTLSARALCDLELLATGGLSPLACFMCRDDYASVVAEMRLATGPNAGALWPLPVVLGAPDGFEASPGDTVALSDNRGTILALLDVEDVFDADLEA